MPILATDHAVNQFLHYGYVIGEQVRLPISAQPGGARPDGLAEEGVSANALIAEGVDRLSIACEATLNSQKHASIHVVPISGGLDSRAILGGLLENVDPSRIQTVTFGTPGTLDFEIGRAVARAAGVAHTQIDLSTTSWDALSLIRFAGQCERPLALFEPYLFHLMRIRFGGECLYWSGFMGEALSGAHLLSRSSTSWAQACSHFAYRNRLTRSAQLSPPDYRAEDSLPESRLCDSDDLAYDDQLDFAVRQGCYIQSVVLLRGYHYRTPFLHPTWTNFILSVPRRYREKQSLYKEILKAAYPRLFSLPTKNSFGLPLAAPRWRQSLRRCGMRARTRLERLVPWRGRRGAPGTNYIDFNLALRERADLKTVVYESIQDLKKRRIVDWIDLDAIWDRHQNRQANHADALTLLASLEINFKTRDMGSE